MILTKCPLCQVFITWVCFNSLTDELVLGERKEGRMKITSKYWRVRVWNTNEEKDFENERLAKEWADRVAYTFNDRTMKFDLIEITEKTRIYKAEEQN